MWRWRPRFTMRRRHNDTCDGVSDFLTASNAQVEFKESPGRVSLAALAFSLPERLKQTNSFDTSLIHIESRKSPTKSLIDVGSRRISIFTVNTKRVITLMFWNYHRIMRRNGLWFLVVGGP
ncbi:hypothetical protein Tco_0341330 [Tanacetum coccineum]